MLIISRKPGESFLIGDEINVTILDLQNDKIKIGISAPKHIAVIRNELKESSEVNQDSANSPGLAGFSVPPGFVKGNI